MAVLLALPELAIIKGFKGVVDFYIHDGIPCARAWPKSPGRIRSPSVMAQWQAFRYMSREWHNLSQDVKNAYDHMSINSGLNARDMAARAYLSGLYRYPTP